MGNREDTALIGTLMERDDVEARPERLPAKITDPSIDVYRVRKYFTCEAWLLVEEVMKVKAYKDSGYVQFATRTPTVRLMTATPLWHAIRV